MRGSDARTHTVANNSASTFTRNHMIGMIHVFTTPSAENAPIPGPDGPPRNSVTAIADIVMTFMNSARKKIANRMPVYSVFTPPTSSCSASTRSNGGGLTSASAAMRKIKNGMKKDFHQNQCVANDVAPFHVCWSMISCVERVFATT